MVEISHAQPLEYRHIPVNHTHLPIIGATLFGIGLVTLVTVLGYQVWNLYHPGDRNRTYAKHTADIVRLSAVLGGLVFVLGGELLFWVSGQLRSYQLVQPNKPLCTLDVYTPADRLPRLVYSIVDEKGRELVEVFPVKKAKMKVMGEMIEWPVWLSKLGLGRHFKLTKVEFIRPNFVADSADTFSTPIHLGSMPLFQRLSHIPKGLSFANTRTFETPLLTADSNFSYRVFIRGDKLVLE